VAFVGAHISLWEALAGRAPGQPIGHADPGLWQAVAERLNPARARPHLRKGIEHRTLATARGDTYVMLRSPDPLSPCYVRLTVEEWRLAQLFTGQHTVARLIAEFARISGRLAPEQVTRVVADLAANRMLGELPVDAFKPLARLHRKPWPVRLGGGLLSALRGRRVVLAGIDPLISGLYQAGGRVLFTRAAAVLMAITAAFGLGLFVWSWYRADQSVFLSGSSYLTGALVLLGLNFVALVCHELGHALAVKHAGRRVPAAGFLVYFGIPSVFVDTSDVWMAGRKARLLTTAAGPVSGLVLAGIAQLVGLLFPPLAPWAFKLSFAWYINVLFNLNPFLALDGYYLLMDWLEIPNLRARGLAWVTGRIRRRSAKFGQLDAEGRLVALYGMLAVLWTVIAINIAYRIYSDRVSGLVLGLWRTGFAGRLLLVAVLAGLCAPMLYLLVGWIARKTKAFHERLGERQSLADVPRKMSLLEESPLARLPQNVLHELAKHATWLRPKPGELLVSAGTAQPSVYVVAEGTLEGRRRGDPGGTVRQRVGVGGAVGMASALTGAPAAMSWHTTGGRLLTMPAALLARTVGPLGGPPPAERAEVEDLLVRSPEFASRSEEDLLELALRATPQHLPPGSEVRLPGPHDGLVVASGTLTLSDGASVRAGQVVRPYEYDHTRVGLTRSPVRLWVLPRPAALPRSSDTGTPVGRMPRYGAHSPAEYPPLAIPPGPPRADIDHSRDGRFERRLWWLVLLLLLFALLLSGTNMLPSPAYAEMPADRAMITANSGRVEIQPVRGTPFLLDKGGRAYVDQGDVVAVASRSRATVLFRGGGYGVACGGTVLQIGQLVSDNTEPIQPRGALAMRQGRLLLDTRPDSAAFAPVRLAISAAGGQVTASTGPARFMVDRGVTHVASGAVTQNGTEIRAGGATLSCGDAEALPRSQPGPATQPSVGPPSTQPTQPADPTPPPTDLPPAGGGTGPIRPPLPPGTRTGPPPAPPVPPAPPPADPDPIGPASDPSSFSASPLTASATPSSSPTPSSASPSSSAASPSSSSSSSSPKPSSSSAAPSSSSPSPSRSSRSPSPSRSVTPTQSASPQPPPPPPPPPNFPPSIAWDGATNASVLGAWNGKVGCFSDLPISTRVPLFLYDDKDDPATLKVVMEFQYGDVEGDWYAEPYFVDMQHTTGSRYEHTFGPYLTEGDFRIRFTVRVTDSDGAVAQLAERIILVRSCPAVPQPPTVEWVESNNGLTLTSTVDGRQCSPGRPLTATVTARVSDDTTPADQLVVYLEYQYGISTGWLPETLASIRMGYLGNGLYGATFGPYSTTQDYAVGYSVLVRDGNGATATTATGNSPSAAMQILGCLHLIY
jgi:putative peptide zinc metalloprotease protein